MSRLLSKLSPFIHKRTSVRSFSSSRTGPCASICVYVEPSPDGGRNVGEVLLYDVSKLELVTSPTKTYPRALDQSALVGASQGWGFFSDRQDRTMIVTDLLNPLVSTSKPKLIPLPQFTSLPNSQTQVVCNVAMSCPPESDEDWTVGVKFLGKQLSLYQPWKDLRWTNISVPFKSWDYSSLMFSKKDKRFYLTVPGSNYLCSWDLNFKEDNNPKFHELVFHNLPNMERPHWKQLDSYCREDHWVESPSGESFLVQWYSSYSPDGPVIPSVMVFREEETKDGRKNMRYTENIGDLCIFISKGEDFCVSASSNPNLSPNSVYLKGRLFAMFNMTDFSVECYKYPEGTPDRIPHSPFWLPPFST